MILQNNTLIASPGKYLMCGSELAEKFTLGKKFVYNNGKTTLINIAIEDVKEVYPVRVCDTDYYVVSTEYGELVSELIRQKYTLDAELALIANYRLHGVTPEEEEFQEWRKLCKEAAKQITNA